MIDYFLYTQESTVLYDCDIFIKDHNTQMGNGAFISRIIQYRNATYSRSNHKFDYFMKNFSVPGQTFQQ